jgi:hypothetical protein
VYLAWHTFTLRLNINKSFTAFEYIVPKSQLVPPRAMRSLAVVPKLVWMEPDLHVLTNANRKNITWRPTVQISITIACIPGPCIDTVDHQISSTVLILTDIGVCKGQNIVFLQNDAAVQIRICTASDPCSSFEDETLRSILWI